MIIARILKLIAGWRTYIWQPFKNWFVGMTACYATWEYKGVLDMQEYLPAESVEIKITKFQSFLLWFADWKIFSVLKTYWKFLNDFFGFSKYLIIFIIGFLLVIIIYYIINYFYTKIRPKRIESEKSGQEFLISLVKMDADIYKNKLESNLNNSLSNHLKLDKKLESIEEYFLTMKDDPKKAHKMLPIIKQNFTKEEIYFVLVDLLKRNMISIDDVKLNEKK